MRDAGANRIVGNVETELRKRLQRELEPSIAKGPFAKLQILMKRGVSAEAAIKQRIAAAEALGKIGGSQFWTMPHGEPDWVHIPAGEFTMGEPEAAHRVALTEFYISKVPITNAQYALFVKAVGHEPPEHWNGKRVPRGKEIHPVVNVTWHDALNYCQWLAEATGKTITLPSEAEWEKAARGADHPIAYPWGDEFDEKRCNVRESRFGGTTPVGIFPNGASPYGCLDMAGNVWEWTRSLWGKDWKKPEFVYPYLPNDPKREDLRSGDDILRLVRGGSWFGLQDFARCAVRLRLRPGGRDDDCGFRVVLCSAPVS